MPWRPMPPNKPASVATAQSWPTARAAGGRAREPRPGLSVFSSRPARRPRAVGSVTVRAGRYLPVVPQRAGCVIRRAVAERRTAQPLTRPTREGYPGRFWLMGEALSTIVRRKPEYTRLFLFAVYNPVNIFSGGSPRFQPLGETRHSSHSRRPRCACPVASPSVRVPPAAPAPVCVPARSAPVLAQIRLVRPLVSPAARPGRLPLCFPACGCPSSVRTPQPRTRRRYRCPTRPSRSPRPRRSALSTPIATSPSPSPMPSNG